MVHHQGTVVSGASLLPDLFNHLRGPPIGAVRFRRAAVGVLVPGGVGRTPRAAFTLGAIPMRRAAEERFETKDVGDAA